MKLKTAWTYLTRLIFLAAAAILLLEGAFRLNDFLYRRNHPKPSLSQQKDFCEYDSRLGWKHTAGARGLFSTDEYSTHLNFNSQGLRGPEHSFRREDNRYRILILGDSFAEGYSVEYENAVPEVLENILKSKGRSCEVINAGCGGYSTDQELIFFQDEGKKYAPDLTILMFYDNDVWFNSQPEFPRGYKPYFSLENGELVLRNVPVPEPETESGISRGTQRDVRSPSVKAWFRKHSRLYAFISGQIKRIGWLYEILLRLRWASPEPIADELRIYEKKPSRAISDAWQITEAILLKLKEEVDSIRGRLLVFYVPDTLSVHAQDWQDMKRSCNISDAQWDVDQPAKVIESICKRNSIDFINPAGLFKLEADKLSNKKERLYFVRDFHWNAKGHKRAAEILAEYIALKYT